MCRRSLMNGTRKLSSFLFLEKNSFSRSNVQHRRDSASVLHSTIAKSPYSDEQFPIGTPAPLQQQKMVHHCLNHNFDKTAAILSRRLSYSSESTAKPNPSPSPSPSPDVKHQEIEGPTVEKDVSPLADESREVTESLLKTMYNASGVLALLGLGHLGMGCYCYTTTDSSPSGQTMMVMFVMSGLAFGFPFSTAFMLRQSLKSMHFFQKMEQIGRLQILTSTMQISKQLRLFFLRLRAISYLCLAGLSFSFSIRFSIPFNSISSSLSVSNIAHFLPYLILIYIVTSTFDWHSI